MLPDTNPSPEGAAIEPRLSTSRVTEVDGRRATVIAYIAGVLGLALFTALIAYQGVGEVAAALAVAGSGLGVITLFHLTTLVAHAIAWRDLVSSSRIRLRTLFWARWIAESINDLLPVLQLGGNVIRARMLARAGTDGAVAGATVVVDVTLNLLAQVLFTTIGVALLFVHLGGGTLAGPVLLGLLLMGSALTGLYHVQRRGIFGRGARVIDRLMRAVGSRSVAASGRILDEEVSRLYALTPSVVRVTSWHLVAWLLGGVEACLALRFLGHPVSLTLAILLESVAEAIRTAAFAVPGAIGVQEGGYVVLGAVLGLPPDVSLALSLTKRVRELLLGVPGVLVWQADELTRRFQTVSTQDALPPRRSPGMTPAAARIIEPSDRVPGRWRPQALRLDGQSLIAAACRRTGLNDFGDPGFEEPLRRLLRSIETEAHLTQIGRFAARADLVRMLVNRLQLQRDRHQHPEIAAQEIRRPLFITGLPRSGSTLLHGLLAQDPANRVPFNWETMYPSPPPERAGPDVDRRIDITERQIRWFQWWAPEFRKIHPVGARLPEECVVILSHSFLSYQFSSSYDVPSYQSWLDEQDLRPAYRFHRKFLQQLQWRCAGERWVLKAPPHLPGLHALFAVYPDARVIFTHRDPLEVVASVASLHVVLRRAFSNAVDPRRVGPQVTRMLAGDIERGLAARDNGCAPAERFLDIAYSPLLADPIATVRCIYAYFDLALTPTVETRMRQFLAENAQDKYGRHEYSLMQFGLDADRERERYRDYRERFGL